MRPICSLRAPNFVALAVLPTLLGSLIATAGPTTLTGQPAPLRQSFDLQVPVPPTPVTIKGTTRLVYELHVTNFADEPLILSELEVLDADEQNVLLGASGEELDRRLARPGAAAAGVEARAIAPGMHGVLYIELDLDGAAAPRELAHRLEYEVANDASPPMAVVRGARTPVRSESPMILAAPLRGGPWAAVYHPSWERGHRRVLYAVGGRARIPGRFAVDWFKMDAGGGRARGDEDRVSNWYGYGAEVLAVADARVVAARDDVPESASLSEPLRHPLEDAGGNYIALDIGHGRYAFYEHLKPGSIRVEPGERVSRGQAIARVGFTGHAAGPHLHFHVADANSPLGAEGRAFVLEGFDLLGAYEDFDAFGDTPWTSLGGGTESWRTKEMPPPNSVVDFR